jgi:pyruvate kinase
MCVTSREDSARQTLLCKGSVPFIIDPIKDDQDYLQLFMAMAQKAKELGLVQSGEHVVAVTGMFEVERAVQSQVIVMWIL